MVPNRPIDVLIPLLAEPPDLTALRDTASWGIVKEHSGSYGVAALVAFVARPHVSAEERAWCDRILVENWVRHERMLRQLEYVLCLLSDEGVPAICLKGPLLAQRYYEPAFLRKPSMDLDIAVAQADLERACNALTSAGYEQDLPLDEALAVSHHVTLTHPSRTRVELHFRLSHQTLGIPVSRFFERTVTSRLPDGLEARILGPADQLLHLMLHLAHSRFGTLFHLYELRRVIKAEPAAVRSEAIRLAIENRFSGALRMLDVAFRVRWGEPFLSSEDAVPATWLNWRLNEKLYRTFERWSIPDRELTLAARLWGRWLEFQITDGPSDAVRSLKLLAQTARVQLGRGAWGTVKNLVYGPPYSPPPGK